MIIGALATKGGNKGLDFLKGNFKVSVPKKKPAAAAAPAPVAAPAPAAPPPAAAPVASSTAGTLQALAAGQARTYNVNVSGKVFTLQVESVQ